MLKRNVFIFGLLALFMIGSLFLGSCEEQKTEPDTNPEDFAFNNMSFTELENEDFSIIGIHEDGTLIAIEDNGYKPERIVYKNNPESNGLYIWVDSEGYPYQAYVNDNIVLFDNFNIENETVDIAIIRPNGEIEILRNVEIDFPDMDRSMADVLRWSGHALSLAGCGIQIAGTISTGGILAPLALLGCGSAVAGILLEIIPSDNPAIEASSAAISAFSGTAGCISSGGLECLAYFVSSAGAIATAAENSEQQNAENIQIAEGILIGGYGDIQITLTWDNTADLDLYVTDPWDETICYYNTTSASGGWLDFDDMNGYGPENIFWENNSAPSGYYYVEVDYYSGYSAANFNVTITIGSEVNSFNGYIDVNETVEVCSFYYSGKGPLNFNQINIIKMREEVKPEK